jgi:hypothetical protein
MTTLVDKLVPRRAAAAGQAAAATPAPATLGRPAPHHPRPQLLRRDRLYGAHLHPMAAAASQRTALRLAGDRLASPCRMGQGGRVRAAAPGDPRPARRAGPAGLVARQRGLGQRARQTWGGGPRRRKSGRSRQARIQDPAGLRGTRAAADRGGHRRQPPGRDHAAGDGRRPPAVRTPSGQRRRRPGKVDADKGYHSTSNRAWLRRRGIAARIARRGIESSTRLGRHRWRVERALSWLSCYRRLAIRWDRDSERWFALVLLACALTCYRRL